MPKITKKKPLPSKPSKKKDILFSDDKDHFSYWSEIDFISIADADFMKLINLVTKNYDTLNEIFLVEAIKEVQAEIKKEDVPPAFLTEEGMRVTEELSHSFGRIYKLFPTLEQYISHRRQFLNINNYNKV